jgi:hypothetical protein
MKLTALRDTATRPSLLDRIGANAPSDGRKPRQTGERSGANAPPPAHAWLKPVGAYVRRQPREYAVARFG